MGPHRRIIFLDELVVSHTYLKGIIVITLQRDVILAAVGRRRPVATGDGSCCGSRIKRIHDNLFHALDLCPTERTALAFWVLQDEEGTTEQTGKYKSWFGIWCDLY